jgi:hypothetical protein
MKNSEIARALFVPWREVQDVLYGHVVIYKHATDHALPKCFIMRSKVYGDGSDEVHFSWDVLPPFSPSDEGKKSYAELSDANREKFGHFRSDEWDGIFDLIEQGVIL